MFAPAPPHEAVSAYVAHVDATLTGAVVDEEGRPVAHAHVRAANKTAVTASDGTFVLQLAAGDSIDVHVRAIGFRSLARTLALVDGRETRVVLRLTRASMLATVVITSGLATADVLAPQDRAVLSSDRLRATTTGSFGRTLARVPGVASIGGGPAASNPVLRGMSQGRIRIARDGIAQQSFDASPRWFPGGDLASVSSIEIVRGPASVLYGASALGGAINVVPRPLAVRDEGAPAIGGLAESQYFSNDDERYGHLSLDAAGRTLAARIGGSRRVADGLRTANVPPYDVTHRRGDPRVTGRLANANVAQSAAYAQVGALGAHRDLQLSADVWRGANNFPNANGKPTGVLNENASVRLQSGTRIGTTTLRATIAEQRTRIRRAATTARTFAVAADSDLWDQDLVNRATTARVTATHAPRFGLAGTVGAELVSQRARTLRSRIQPSIRIDDAALFAAEERRVERLTLTGGLRVATQRQHADARPARRYHVLAASAGAAYRVWSPLVVSATASSGFRPPSAIDLYTDESRPSFGGWVEGNPALRPERALGVEAGVRVTSARVHADVALFRTRFTDFVYLARTDRTHVVGSATVPVFATQQAPARDAGIDASASVQLTRAAMLDASWSALRSRNLARHEALPLMPADRARVGLRVMPHALAALGAPYAELGVRHVWAKRRAGPTEPFADADDNPAGWGTASTPAYSLIDAGVGARVSLGAHAATVHVGVENLADRAYRDFLDTQKGFTLGPGRDVTLRVSVPFAVR